LQNTDRTQSGVLIWPHTVDCFNLVFVAVRIHDPSGKNQEAFRATLTEEGQEKLRQRVKREVEDLVPGVDYVIKDPGRPEGSWLPLPDN
jgi:hypothetical protein